MKDDEGASKDAKADSAERLQADAAPKAETKPQDHAP
jgi:hypothetical protein